MAIEISANGVTKVFRYYPSDAFYVNGQQVKEAWVNGMKYYPENEMSLFGMKFLKCYTGTLRGQFSSTIRNLGLVKYSFAWIYGYDPSWFSVKTVANEGYKFLDAKYPNDNNRNYCSSISLLLNAKVEFDPAVYEDAVIYPTRLFHRSLFNNEGKRIFDALMNGVQIEFSGENISIRDGVGWDGMNPLRTNFSSNISARINTTVPFIKFDFYDMNNSYLNSWGFTRYNGDSSGGSTDPAIRYNSYGGHITQYAIGNFEPSKQTVSASDLFPLPS